MDRTEWVMVPREPTAQMLKAAADEDLKVWLDCGQPAADHSIIWRAMLATARTPVQDLQPVAWIDPGSYEAMLACEDGCLRYLTRHPREGDIPLYSTSPDAAARIAELEAERDRLRSEMDKCAAALPGSFYMDPPDGGDVGVSEQLRRMIDALKSERDALRKALVEFVQYADDCDDDSPELDRARAALAKEPT